MRRRPLALLAAAAVVLLGLGWAADAFLGSHLRAKLERSSAELSQAPELDEETARRIARRGREDLERTRRRLRLALFAAGAILLVALAFWERRALNPVPLTDELLPPLGMLDDGAPLAGRLRAADTPRELRPLIEQLDKLRARLAAGLERERRFSSEIAQQLRAPVERLRRLAGETLPGDEPAAVTAFFADVRGQALEMERTIADLLALARLEGGLETAREEDFDLRELLAELAAEIPRLVCEQPLTLRLRSDRRKWRRFLLHLLVPAGITPENRGLLRPEVTCGEAGSGPILLTVLQPGPEPAATDAALRLDESLSRAYADLLGVEWRSAVDAVGRRRTTLLIERDFSS